MKRRVRLGMVGGGANSVIGETHRRALRIDGLYELTAGAFSRNADIAMKTAQASLVDPSRTYLDFHEMADREMRRDDGIEVVVVATPPESHFEIAQTFLQAGIHVICEKPMTSNATEAEQLVDEVERSGKLFVVTHVYTGYPMVRHAREMIRNGLIGDIRLVEAEFAIGVPGNAREPTDPADRHWRLKTDAMGPTVILGELGSHAHNIIEFVTGSRAVRVAAKLDVIAKRRDVYDNAYLTVEFANGSFGRIWSSYVATGNEHGLSFRVFGDDGSLAWQQEEPEYLWHRSLGGPAIRLSRGMNSLSTAARQSTRLPPGHPEGFLLAFANLYRDFARALGSDLAGASSIDVADLLPSVRDGLATMYMIEAARRAAASGEAVELTTQR